MSAIPDDFAWRQSIIRDYLRCPRRVYLEYVAAVPPDWALDGYAAIVGSASHAGLASVLRRDGRPLQDVLTAAFADEIQAVQARGATTDPERVEAALHRLLGEQLALIEQLAQDPRVLAVEWDLVEQQFSWKDQFGRCFRGTVDAGGRARERVQFGVLGRDPVWLERGERVLVDWKTGSETQLDYISLALSVQLGLYSHVLGGIDRAFIGQLLDLERPKRPKDARGDPIAKWLDVPNPAWAAAAGVDPHDLAAFTACTKRPRGAGEKWLRRENPAFVAATQQPRGPLFHEARLDRALIAQTIADVIDAARAGLWPAAGAATGECPRCAWRTRCAHQVAQGPA